MQELQTFIKMPGRPSIAVPTASRGSDKTSTQISALRKSLITPSLLLPGEGFQSTLRTQICNVFREAQKSGVAHRKLLVGLRKIQEACCCELMRPGKPGRQEFSENDFKMEIWRCVTRLMSVKRSEVTGDRIIRFLGSFLRFANDKGTEEL